MWPFSKKKKQPEVKIDEENPKQPITLQWKFDPVATQLMLKSKESKFPRKEPEATLEVKLDCPTCKQVLEKYSKNRFKCPHCRNWIYFLDNRLVTEEDYGRLREGYYRRRYEERLKRSMAEDLAKLGLSEEMLQQREQELARSA
ncbi:MAG: hypothetical protein ABSG73_15135 [Candidatus Aminicenantales bacterium]|jgi:hypothetical protein